MNQVIKVSNVDMKQPINIKNVNTISKTEEYEDTEIKQKILEIENKTNKNTNDINYLSNKIVIDLQNYYLKSETLSQTEIMDLIGQIKTAKIEVVEKLPEFGENNIIYFVPKTNQGVDDIYNEYICIDGSYELIGNTQIDLSNYITIEQLNEKFSNYVLSSKLEEILKSYARTEDIPTKNSKLENDSNFLSINNKIEYIVENDYTPAHKKYVDDAIADRVNTTKEKYRIYNVNIPYLMANGTMNGTNVYFQKIIPDIINVINEAYQDNVVPLFITGRESQVFPAIFIPTDDSIINQSDMLDYFSYYMTSNTTGNSTSKNQPNIMGTAFLRLSLNWTDGIASVKSYNQCLIQRNDTKYLTTDNTGIYTPINDYNPATKKYVDDLILSLQSQINELKNVLEIPNE